MYCMSELLQLLPAFHTAWEPWIWTKKNCFLLCAQKNQYFACIGFFFILSQLANYLPVAFQRAILCNVPRICLYLLNYSSIIYNCLYYPVFISYCLVIVNIVYLYLYCYCLLACFWLPVSLALLLFCLSLTELDLRVYIYIYIIYIYIQIYA